MTGIKGYTPLSDEQQSAMNVFKEFEERVLRHAESVERDITGGLDPDPIALANGRSQIKAAFMWLNRAIAKPQRISLPSDDDGA